jgi:Asp/Glu/hydantoin racemase
MSVHVSTVRKRGGLAGFHVGILVLDTVHELVLGNVQHARSFDFPVLYEVVRGVSWAALMQGDQSARDIIVERARALEGAGVDVVVGACGSFANYQAEVAAAVNVPVFLSILLEVPLLLRALPRERQLGILFASTTSFTDRVREQCGIAQTDRIVAIGADALPAFRPIAEQAGVLDDLGLRDSLVELVRASLRDHPRIGAWLLQCSDLPPYAAAIQRATGLPVFDMVTLIRHLHEASDRHRFAV